MKNSIKFFIIAVLLFPILNIYGFGHINAGLILLLLAIVVLTFKNKINLEYPKRLGTFFILVIVTRFIWGIGVNINDVFSLIYFEFALLIGISCKFFNINYGIKVYRIIVFISCMFLILQEITYLFTPVSISGIIPNAPLVFSYKVNNYAEYLQMYYRKASFFREPAYFSAYIIPMLIMELFHNQYKSSYLNALFITFCILLSASGTGFILSIFVWTIWLVRNFTKKFEFKNLFIVLIFIFAFLSYGNDYFQSSKGMAISKRIEGTREVEKKHSSVYIRIYRGYYIYFNVFNFGEKVFGVNNPHKNREIVQHSLIRSTFYNKEMVLNGIQYVLIKTGIIGFIIFIAFFINLLRKNSIVGKVLISTYLILSLIAPTMMNENMLLYITFAYSFQKQSRF